MKAEIIPGEQKFFRERLLAAVDKDKWLPILQQPFDYKKIDTRFTGTLKPALTILGRLAITLHATYEEACEFGLPLLKCDKSKKKIQYAIEDNQLGFYHLVFLQGKEINKQRYCQLAKFVLAPESSLEKAKQEFITHPSYNNEVNLYYRERQTSHEPWFEYGSNGPIEGATRCVVLDFDCDHRIRAVLAAYYGNILRSYYFLNPDDIRIEFNKSSLGGWSSSWNQEAKLNRDGAFRKENGEVVSCNLAEELLEIISDLPMEHYVNP